MFTMWFMALLCLLPLSQAAPVDCGALVKPLAQVDLGDLQGRWIMVAESTRITEGSPAPIPTTSVVIEFINHTYTQGNRIGDRCGYLLSNVSFEGPNYSFSMGVSEFTGTLYQTSCPDCVMLSFIVNWPHYKSKELCLFSRRRDVEQKELEEFRAQLECLKMPPHVVMDPEAQLCL